MPRIKNTKPTAPEVNKVSEQNKTIRRESVLASDQIAPVVFGRDRFFAKPWNAFAKDDFLYIPYLVSWGGPIQTDVILGSAVRGISAYNNVYIDGVDINETDGFIDSGGEIEYRYGPNRNNPSVFLAEAVTGFTNKYDGFAYIVLKIPSGISNGFPRVEVDINGLKIKRRASNYPFVETGATPSGTNLVPNSANPMLWTIQNGATHQDTGNNIGFFQETTVASGGLTYALTRLIAGATSGSLSYGMTVYYKGGTSGKARFQVYNQTKNVSSVIVGDIGSLPAQGTNPTTAGVFTLVSDYSLGAYRVFKATFNPVIYTDAVYFYIGPQSTVSGENVFVYGAQIDNLAFDLFGIPTFTENPIDIHAHLLEQAGETLDAASVQKAANWNNDVLPYSQKPRRSMGFTIDSVNSITNTAEYIRAYTGCSITYEDGKVFYARHEARATSHTIGDDEIAKITIDKVSSRDVPNKFIVNYTDQNDGFSIQEAVVTHPDIATLPVRISKLSFLGCNDFQFAKREATERFQRADKSDLRVTLKLFDEGLEILIGDICSVSYANILTNKLLEVVSITSTSAGDWLVDLEEYDPLFFSSDVESDPTFPDTQLPAHVAPPAVAFTTSDITEEIYRRKNGEIDNRLIINWGASVSPYVRNYVVRIIDGGVIASINETGLRTAYGPLQEGVTYTIEIVAVTSLYEGAVASATFTPAGKTLPPPNVTVFDVYEVGGQVRLSWGEVLDLDIIGYEIRYGAVGVTYENATQLDIISSLRYVTSEVPEGTYDFLIKAKDSVGNFSALAKRVSSITVTLDERSLLVTNGTYPDRASLDALVHRTKEVRCSTYDIIYTNTSSQTWTALFGTNPLPAAGAIASKQAAISSGFFRHATAVYNVGTPVSGNFGSSFNVTNYSAGTLGYQYLSLQASANYVEYQSSSVQVKAQYGYQEFRGTGLVRIDLSELTFRVNAVTKNETDTDLSANGGRTISLAGTYSRFKNITATPIFSGTQTAVAAYCVIDAVNFTTSPNTFKVFMFDSGGNQLPDKSFVWRFEGV